NLLTYDHNGGETTSDSFGFSLADGGENGSTPATGTFTFSISPVNDAPVVNGKTNPFINEIHYDNSGADTGEAVEIAGAAGTDLTGWTLVFYNGADGTLYRTENLSETLADLGSGFGVSVVNLPTDGIQNGAPDGIALVNDLGEVIEFLSYEGSFTAVDGPAAGMMSADIGVAESGTTPVGFSLQRTGSGPNYTWATEAANTFGAINTGQSYSAGTLAAETVAEDTPLIFSLANGNAITVSDADADAGAADPILVTLSVSNGTLTLGATTGLTGLTGNGSSTVSFQGTVAEVNSALDGLGYQGSPNFSGSDTLTVDVDDQGNTGSGGALTDSATVNISVTSVNDAPIVATNTGATVLEGSTGNVITTAMLNEGDPDDSGVGLTYTITSNVNNGTLKLNGSAIGLNDTFTQQDIDDNLLTYDHNGGETTSDSFGFSLADGGENGSTPATGTFTLTVTPVNDGPVLGNHSLTISEGQQVLLTTAMFSATDVDSNDPDLVFTVSNLTAIGFYQLNNNTTVTSFTQAQVAAGEIVAIHDGGEIVPAFDVSVSDGSASTTPTAAVITFTAINDQPYLDANGEFDESLVNTTTAGEQVQAETVNLTGGNYVILWNDGVDVRAQIFAANGTSVGGELLLDDTAAVGETSLVATQSGGFAISWFDGTDIRARTFDSAGSATGASVVVASGASSIPPEIAQLSNGKFVVVYETGGDTVVQMLTSGLALDGGPITVPDVTTGTQTLGNIVALQSGGFAVGFADAAGRDGETYGVYLQRFDSAGAAVGGNIPVTQNTAGAQRIDDLVELAGGEIVVTWRDNTSDGSSSGVLVRVFSAAGVAITNDIVVPQSTAGHQDDGNLTALSDGSFVVTWQSGGANGEKEVFIRRFAADGSALSDEMLLNTDATHWNRNVQATALAGDRLAVTWSQGDIGGTNYDIVQRHFDFSGHVVSYAENDPATVVHDNISLVDFDDTNLESATIQISSGYVDGEDVLAFVNQNGIIGTWNSGSGTLTLSGTATVANYEAALRSVTYENLSDDPSTANRTISWSVNDGNDNRFVRTSSIQIISANDAPVLTNGSSIGYSEGNGALPFTLSSLSDADSADFNGGILTFTIASAPDTTDTLGFGNFAGVSTAGVNVLVSGITVGTMSGGSGGTPLTVTFNANATVARVESLFQALAIRNNTDDNPVAGARSLEVTVTDGVGGTSNVATATA
ncbi:MAG: hypothetical protein KDA89_21110, partial [Planctomycetaceae bacterium]|nr:hypothetical protein [Planctomycetaceae bacterium]